MGLWLTFLQPLSTVVGLIAFPRLVTFRLRDMKLDSDNDMLFFFSF
jgi:hypothetical protein